MDNLEKCHHQSFEFCRNSLLDITSYRNRNQKRKLNGKLIMSKRTNLNNNLQTIFFFCISVDYLYF